MSIRGRVRNGVIVLDPPAMLPEGSEVDVRPIGTGADNDEVPTVYDRLKDIIGIAEGLPADSSVNHDHYLYGAPKQ